MHAQMQLKGQRASVKVLKGHTSSCKLSFPYGKLKCLRGDVMEEELLLILGKVIKKELSLSEMESEINRIKEMRALQNYFVKYTDSPSWVVAKER